MRLYFERLDAWTSVPDTFASLYGSAENAFWLDREHELAERFSVIGASSSVISLDESGLEQFREAHARLAEVAPAEREAELPFDFRPGLVGTIHYEFKLATGGSARHWTGEPLGYQLLVDRAVVFDHDARRMYFIGAFLTREEFDSWYHAALLRLALVGGEAGNHRIRSRPGSLIWRDDEASYLEKIGAAKRHIESGDCYQICLTTGAEAMGDWEPLAIFLRLRTQNPAPYSGYLRVGGFHLISSSPERFLKASAGGGLSSKPIKGTRPRGESPEQDRIIAQELLESEKERAENLMIVDLVRNDLGRVSPPESVHVSRLFEVESYATVHQLVSTVESQLAPGSDAIDALAAMFPAGSMTGAPKLRAMEIIDDLEAAPRGAYSGIFGYLACNGAADWGMTIRSIVIEGRRLSIGVGGGITSDSVPSEEFQETRIKARALLRAIGIDILG